MQSLTIYYDGGCPLCLAEIHFLKSRNKLGLLEFVDVAAPQYDEATHQLSCKLALATMQGRLADGTQLEGIAVFAEAYKRANLPTLAWLFTRPWLAPILNASYYVFAKYRHGISKTIGPLLLRLSKRCAPETSQ
jgi:predicted DCC family thiol-disulfide oxidoreductase YuxK